MKIKASELSRELKRVGSVATKKEFATILQKLSIDAFRELVLRSAVDTGFLRSNWDVTTRTAGSTELSDYDGGAHNDAIWPNLSLKAGDYVTLYNNTEYAAALEFGTSKQRAQPMVTPTYHMILDQAKQLTSALSRKRVH